MRAEPAWSPQSLRRPRSPTPAGRATKDWPRPASTTTSRPPPSTSSASTHGGTARSLTLVAPATSHAWNSPSQPERRMTNRVDMTLKQQAADRLTPPGVKPGRYQAADELLAFLADL